MIYYPPLIDYDAGSWSHILAGGELPVSELLLSKKSWLQNLIASCLSYDADSDTHSFRVITAIS